MSVNGSFTVHKYYSLGVVSELKRMGPSLKITIEAIPFTAGDAMFESIIRMGSNHDTCLTFRVYGYQHSLRNARGHGVDTPNMNCIDVLAYAVKVQKTIERTERAASLLKIITNG